MKRLCFAFLAMIILLSGCMPKDTAQNGSSSEDISSPSSNSPSESQQQSPQSSEPDSQDEELVMPSESASSDDASTSVLTPEPQPEASAVIKTETPPVSSSSQISSDSVPSNIQSSSDSVPSNIQSSVTPVSSSSEAPQQNLEIPSSSSVPLSSAPPEMYAPERPNAQTSVSATVEQKEIRAVWFSYLEFVSLAQNKTEAQFTYNISTAFDYVNTLGFNSVWVQVRPFGDALYKSSIFPYSYVLTGTEGKDPGYDPLEIMVREAHRRGLKIEAWVNPYRIRAGVSKPLSTSNPAVAHLTNGGDAVIQYNNIISYNPASETARNIIVSGVTEIVQNYDVDGIHFDDYFYPTTDLAFDSAYYNSYRAAGGTLSQADWRRDNVNKLISSVYAAIKSTDSSVIFGVSPQGNMNNNYNSQYVDIAHWLRNKGYVDYICPQIYFGFKNDTLPFAKTVNEWSDMITNGQTKLYVGIAAYKIGTEDKYAGRGAQEWISDQALLARMITESRNSGNVYSGFSMYRYDFLSSPASGVRGQMNDEISSLKELLKD